MLRKRRYISSILTALLWVLASVHCFAECVVHAETQGASSSAAVSVSSAPDNCGLCLKNANLSTFKIAKGNIQETQVLPPLYLIHALLTLGLETTDNFLPAEPFYGSQLTKKIFYSRASAPNAPPLVG